MEDANGDNNEGELTSTMDNVTSVSNKEEKSDTSDATPTSSTDTSHFTASSHIVSDDPISSTSSDTMDQQKSKTNQGDFKSFSADLMDVKDGDNDLLHMSGEKITEDVEDLVHDLESLLGEPAPSFVLPSHNRSLATKETAAMAKDTTDVGQRDKGGGEEGAQSDMGSTSTKQLESELIEDAGVDQVDNVDNNPPGTEETVNKPATSKVNNEAEIKSITQDLESSEPQDCDTSTESVAETNQCIQDQDITRSEMKEKDDCDNIEATNNSTPPETLSSESPSEVDTTVVEADTVAPEGKEPEASPKGSVDLVTIPVESKSSSPSAPECLDESDSGKAAVEKSKPETAELTPKVQGMEEKSVDNIICELTNTAKDIPEGTAAIDNVEVIVSSPEKVNSPKLKEKGNGLDYSQVLIDKQEDINILPLEQPKTDCIKINNLENDKIEEDSVDKPDGSEPCEVEIVQDQSENQVVTNSKAKNQSNDITSQAIKSSVEKPEMKGVNDKNSSEENEIPVIPNDSESAEVPKECTENEAIATESKEIVECTKAPITDETETIVEQPIEDIKFEEAITESEKVVDQVENIEQEITPEPEVLKKPEEVPTETDASIEISNESIGVQLVESTEAHSIETIKIQPIGSTEIRSVESTEAQPVESTEIQSIENTEVQSVESTEVQCVGSTEVQSVESTKAQSIESNEVQSIESTEVQSVKNIDVQSVESTEVQSVERTKVQSVERVEVQSVESTEVRSVESTEFQSIENTKVSSIATVSVAEAECSKQHEGQEVKNGEKPFKTQTPAESDHIPESSSIEAQVEEDREVLKHEEETVKISTTQHIDVTPVSAVEEKSDETSEIEPEECGLVQQNQEIEQNEPESTSQSVNEKETERHEIEQHDESEVKTESLIQEVNLNKKKMKKSDLPVLNAETLPCKELDGDEMEKITTDVNEVEDTSEAVADRLECKGYKLPGPVNLSEESGDDEVPSLALEPDDEIAEKQSIPVKQIVNVKMDLTNEVVTTTQLDDDVQQNLETMRAVASLHSIEVQKQEESPLTEKERIEMEALSKAVESITESGSDYENKNYVEAAELEQVDSQETAYTNDSHETPDDTSEQIEKCSQFDKNIVEESEMSIKTSECVEKTDLRVETLQTSEVNDTLLKVTQNMQIPKKNVDHKEPVLETPQLIEDPPRKVEIINEAREKESKTKPNERSKRHKKTSESKLEELSINVDVPDKEKPYSPKITIKPIKAPDEEVSTTSSADSELAKGSLKMTITKQSHKMHSIKMGETDSNEPPQEQEEPVPKIKIKSKAQVETPQKMSTRSSRQAASTSTQRSNSPRFHIKPVVKPEKEASPLKIKIGKSDEPTRKHSPKLNIKPIPKPDEEMSKEATHSPRKAMKSQKQAKSEEPDQTPKITIKPIPKPDESPTPTKLTIKPLKKPEETETEKERSSPKVIIKPIVKPSELEAASEERIVLKINKGNLPAKEPKHSQDDEKEEKLAKITLKISKDGGHHIVQPDEIPKRPNDDSVTVTEKNKRQKVDVESSIATRSKHKEITESPMETRSRHKEPIPDVTIELKSNPISPVTKHKDSPTESHIETKRIKLRDLKQNMEQMDDDVKIVEPKVNSPIVISEDSHSQDSSCVIVEDAPRPAPMMVDLPVENPKPTPEVSSPQPAPAPAPKKRGRPRKVPLEIRQDFKEQPPALAVPVAPPTESGRPKRSCRSQSALDTLGLKPRKPRGPGRGRGSARGMGTRPIPMKPEKSSK